MKPRHSWSAGEPRRTPVGTPLDGLREESYCSFDMGGGDDGNLAECLCAAVSKLKAYRTFLRQMSEARADLSFYVFWYPNGDTGAVFDTRLLADLTDLGITLGINVYDDRKTG